MDINTSHDEPSKTIIKKKSLPSRKRGNSPTKLKRSSSNRVKPLINLSKSNEKNKINAVKEEDSPKSLTQSNPSPESPKKANTEEIIEEEKKIPLFIERKKVSIKDSKRNRSLSMVMSALPKTNKQKLKLRMKRNESLKSIIMVEEMRSVLFREINKNKSSVMHYLSDLGNMKELIDFLLCTEINSMTGYLCHWSCVFLSTKSPVFLDNLFTTDYMDQLFSFFENDLYLENKVLNQEDYDFDINTLPNQFQYYLMVFQNLIVERGVSLVCYLLDRDNDEEFLSKLINYFRFIPGARFFLEILCLEYRLRALGTHESGCWHEKNEIISRIYQEFLRAPKQYIDNHKILHQVQSETIPIAVPHLLDLLLQPDTCNTSLEFYLRLYQIDKTFNTNSELVTETFKYSDKFKFGLTHPSALVTQNTLHLIYLSCKETKNPRIIMETINDIIDLLFKYPKRNVFHNMAIQMLVWIFDSCEIWAIGLQEYIITQSNLLIKARRCIRKGQGQFYTASLRYLFESIPEKFKDNKTKKFQTELFQIAEPSPIWEVPEELIAKKQALKNTIVDTEQQYLNPTHNHTPNNNS